MAPSITTVDAMSALLHPSTVRMDLGAHDEDPAPVEDTGTEQAPEPEAAAEGSEEKPEAKPEEKPAKPDDDSLGETGKKALTIEREKRKAAEAEARQAKADKAAADKRIQEFEDGQRSDLEKAQKAAERAAEREQAANRRAVTSDLRSAAILADAADPGIVVDLLVARGLDGYLTDAGVDTDAIEKAVAALLELKPILRKPAETAPPLTPPAPKPKPDPSQGPRGPAPAKDYTTAPREEVDKALAEMGIRRRS